MKNQYLKVVVLSYLYSSMLWAQAPNPNLLPPQGNQVSSPQLQPLMIEKTDNQPSAEQQQMPKAEEAQNQQNIFELDGNAQEQQEIPELEELVERFYLATSAKEMEDILKQVAENYVQEPIYFELDSIYRHFQGNSALTIELLLENILSDGSKDAKLTLIKLSQYDWSYEDRKKIMSYLAYVSEGHPEPSVRAFSQWMRLHDAHIRNDLTGLQMAKEQLGQLLSFSLIGTWDNDQGKGFDEVYPPELGVDFNGKYQGKLLEISWRDQYPTDIRGKLDLKELFYPSEWQVAYAVSHLMVEADTKAKLLVSTSDPIKIWVNQKEIFQAPRIDGWLFDGIQLDIDLKAGVNEIMIKSAQQKGEWLLVGRITDELGEALEYQGLNQAEYQAWLNSKAQQVPSQNVAQQVPSQNVAQQVPSQNIAQQVPSQNTDVLNASKVIDETAFIAQIQAQFDQKEYPTRSQIQQLQMIKEIGLHTEHLHILERLHLKNPNSIIIQYELALSSWQNQERGVAADLLNQLQKKHGKDLPLFSVLQSKFWTQQNLDIKARDLIEEVITAHPQLVEAHIWRSKLLDKEGWDEERCALLNQFYESNPSESTVRRILASCLKQSKQDQLATKLELQGRRELPLLSSLLEEEYRGLIKEKRFIHALDTAQRFMDAWPQTRIAYDLLSEAYWYLGQSQEALDTVKAWTELNPLDPYAWKRRAEYLTVLGKKEEAIQSWEEALKRDPDNQKIAKRLGYLKPKQSEPWLADVPSEAKIEEAIQAKNTITIHPNSNIVNLLDDEVSLLNQDGSTFNIVTIVALAVNQEGRDELTEVYLRSKKAQLMLAYAVDPNGQRIEAASIRDGVVRYRQLQIGSIVVYQYRVDEKSPPYLVGHVAKDWWFQSIATQSRLSRFVMWMPKNHILHQKTLGNVQASESIEGELKRVAWWMENADPLMTEPKMPPLSEVMFNLRMSTVPSWDSVFQWEKELLRDAFRASPEVEALAKKLVEGANGEQEKINRIYEYVTKNIRYQQDYEHTIAGVKPHSASMVVARQYGDCKDKAVLMITLAKQLGLKAEFALVLTRDAGKVDLSLPSQQFNHAIAYIPAQGDIKEGRFYDSTVDALDVVSLRSDDQGTTSLLFDPDTQSHRWLDIPFQSPKVDSYENQFDIKLNAQGDIQGELKMTLQGRNGEYTRQGSRNPETFKQMMEHRLDAFSPGSTMLSHSILTDPTNLFEPAQASIVFEKKEWARMEGNQLRLPTIIDWSPKAFSLPSRRFDLVLNIPSHSTWEGTLHLPDSIEVDYLPEDKKIESPCITLERKISVQAPQTLNIKWYYESRCERLNTESYQQHLPFIQEMRKLIQQEVILKKSLMLPEK